MLTQAHSGPMEHVNIDQLLDHLADQNSPEEALVSIYFPVHARQMDATQIHFKNAVQQLKAQRASVYESFLAPRLAEMEEYIQGIQASQLNGTKSMALMIDEHGFNLLKLSHLSPEMAFAGRRYMIAPLLLESHNSEDYFVLCVSQNKVRLLRVDRQGNVREHPLPELEPIREQLSIDEMMDSLQHHTEGRGSQNKGRHPHSGIGFHGHGGDLNQKWAHMIHEYLKEVKRVVEDNLHRDHPHVVFAGDKRLTAELSDMWPSFHVLGMLEGNYDASTEADVVKKASPLASQAEEDEIASLVTQFGENVRLSTQDLQTVIQNAELGNVDILLVNQKDFTDAFNELGRRCCMFESAIRETVRHSGQLRMTTSSPTVARFRYLPPGEAQTQALQ